MAGEVERNRQGPSVRRAGKLGQAALAAGTDWLSASRIVLTSISLFTGLVKKGLGPKLLDFVAELGGILTGRDDDGYALSFFTPANPLHDQNAVPRNGAAVTGIRLKMSIENDLGTGRLLRRVASVSPPSPAVRTSKPACVNFS